MPQENLITRIFNSAFFKKATQAAGSYAQNKSGLLGLLQRVLSKNKLLSGGNFDEIKVKINLLVRLLRAFAAGKYKTVPWSTITRTIAVLIYFVSPLDIIPDMLPIIGLTDDVALVLWLFNAISDDLEAFRIWERKQNTIEIG
jgi:uncharacterized membrane protein YkvA (DUF1232 family)